MTGQECSQKHPSSVTSKRTDSNTKEKNILNAVVSLKQKTCGCTVAGECVLVITPVKVKSLRSEKVVETYTFMDPGSSAAFCTEALMRQLDVRGRKTKLRVKNENWIQGLHFLWKKESDWPERPDQSSHVLEDVNEVKKSLFYNRR